MLKTKKCSCSFLHDLVFMNQVCADLMADKKLKDIGNVALFRMLANDNEWLKEPIWLLRCTLTTLCNDVDKGCCSCKGLCYISKWLLKMPFHAFPCSIFQNQKTIECECWVYGSIVSFSWQNIATLCILHNFLWYQSNVTI